MPELTDDITITDEQRAAFFAHMEQHPGSGYKRALRAVGVQGSGAQLHRLIEREKLDLDARGVQKELLLESIWKHGVEGVDEPVYTPAGIHAGDIRRYSARDRALLARIFGLDHNRVQIAAEGGRLPVDLGIDVSRLTDDELAQLRGILERGAEA